MPSESVSATWGSLFVSKRRVKAERFPETPWDQSRTTSLHCSALKNRETGNAGRRIPDAFSPALAFDCGLTRSTTTVDRDPASLSPSVQSVVRTPSVGGGDPSGGEGTSGG